MVITLKAVIPPGFEGTSACWRLQCHPHTAKSKNFEADMRKLRYPACSCMRSCASEKEFNWNQLGKNVLDLIGVLMAETSGHSGCEPPSIATVVYLRCATFQLAELLAPIQVT